MRAVGLREGGTSGGFWYTFQCYSGDFGEGGIANDIQMTRKKGLINLVINRVFFISLPYTQQQSYYLDNRRHPNSLYNLPFTHSHTA